MSTYLPPHIPTVLKTCQPINGLLCTAVSCIPCIHFPSLLSRSYIYPLDKVSINESYSSSTYSKRVCSVESLETSTNTCK